jgi:hypothetical protein
MVEILTAVLSDGLPAVEAACTEALREGVHSADVILNILAPQRERTTPVTILKTESLRLRHEPVDDCACYDTPLIACSSSGVIFGISLGKSDAANVHVGDSVY